MFFGCCVLIVEYGLHIFYVFIACSSKLQLKKEKKGKLKNKFDYAEHWKRSMRKIARYAGSLFVSLFWVNRRCRYQKLMKFGNYLPRF